MKCAKCNKRAYLLRRVEQQGFLSCERCRPSWDVSALRDQVKELQSQLTQARAELVRERTLHADLRGIYGDLLKGHRFRDHRAIEDLIPRFEAYCKAFSEAPTREELIDE